MPWLETVSIVYAGIVSFALSNVDAIPIHAPLVRFMGRDRGHPWLSLGTESEHRLKHP